MTRLGSTLVWLLAAAAVAVAAHGTLQVGEARLLSARGQAVAVQVSDGGVGYVDIAGQVHAADAAAGTVVFDPANPALRTADVAGHARSGAAWLLAGAVLAALAAGLARTGRRRPTRTVAPAGVVRPAGVGGARLSRAG